jgi:hypothetical protein
MAVSNIHDVIKHIDNIFIKAKKRRIGIVEQAIVSALSAWIITVIILGAIASSIIALFIFPIFLALGIILAIYCKIIEWKRKKNEQPE